MDEKIRVVKHKAFVVVNKRAPIDRIHHTFMNTCRIVATDL